MPPSILLPSDTMSAAQISAQVLDSTLRRIDELVNAFLIEIRLALLSQPTSYQVRRPADFQEAEDFLLEGCSFDDITYLAPLCFTFQCLALRGVRKILFEIQMLISTQFPTDGRSVSTEYRGDFAVILPSLLELIDFFPFLMPQLYIWFLVHIL